MENEIGNRLYELRIQHGLSNMKAAVKVGTSPSMWNRWETGKCNISPQFIIAICKGFGVSADWLLGLENKKS